MSVNQEEANKIRLKKHFEPKRRNARYLYIFGFIFGLSGIPFLFFNMTLAGFIFVTGFVIMVLGSYLKKKVEARINKASTGLFKEMKKNELNNSKKKKKYQKYRKSDLF